MVDIYIFWVIAVLVVGILCICMKKENFLNIESGFHNTELHHWKDVYENTPYKYYDFSKLIDEEGYDKNDEFTATLRSLGIVKHDDNRFFKWNSIYSRNGAEANALANPRVRLGCRPIVQEEPNRCMASGSFDIAYTPRPSVISHSKNLYDSMLTNELEPHLNGGTTENIQV